MSKPALQIVLNAAKALGDAQRIRALMALQRRELCACQIVELLGLTPSTVSRHMAVLKRAGLIESRKDGRWIYYQLAAGSDEPTVANMLEVLVKALQRDATVLADRKALSAIMKKDPHELCRNQLRRST